jgi:hypothetical protein
MYPAEYDDGATLGNESEFQKYAWTSRQACLGLDLVGDSAGQASVRPVTRQEEETSCHGRFEAEEDDVTMASFMSIVSAHDGSVVSWFPIECDLDESVTEDSLRFERLWAAPLRRQSSMGLASLGPQCFVGPRGFVGPRATGYLNNKLEKSTNL